MHAVAPLRILVTRPQPQADEWVQALREHQLDAHALPLIAIEAPADPAPVAELWRHLARQRLLMFVSPAAVDWFFRLRPPDTAWPAETLAAAPGPGTARQLMAAGAACGLTSSQILSPQAHAEQFDSESLWPALAPLNWQGQSVCIISGGDHQEARGRTWLAEQLRAQGAQVHALLCYQRGPGHWTPAQQALANDALAEPGAHVWLFSSSQGIDYLIARHVPELPSRAHTDWSQARALSTHPRITERARSLGLTHILETRPTLQAVVAALRPLSAYQAGVDTINSL